MRYQKKRSPYLLRDSRAAHYQTEDNVCLLTQALTFPDHEASPSKTLISSAIGCIDGNKLGHVSIVYCGVIQALTP